MNDKDQPQNDVPVQSPVSNDSVPDNSIQSPESPRPRPDPSYGELTEGESGASLWKTIKMALRE